MGINFYCLFLIIIVFQILNWNFKNSRCEASPTLLEPTLSSSSSNLNVNGYLEDGDKCQGSCMSRSSCSFYGGIVNGWCIGSNICCSFEHTCDKSSSELISFFKSPAYPLSSNQSMYCGYTINSLKGVCTLRLDFLDLEMSNAVRTTSSPQKKCILDSFMIFNNKNVPNEPICGFNGYSFLLEVNPETSITLLFLMQSKSWKWKVRVRQILCEQIQPWKNERDCGQQRLKEVEEADIEEDDSNTIYPLVVNGEAAGEAEFPWQVSLMVHDEHRCGATIVNERFVLTAAHCLYPLPHASLDDIQIAAGTFNLTGEMEMINVEAIILSYDYKPFMSHSNDVTLIKLKKPLSYSKNIRPICLPTSKDQYLESGTTIATGWGKLSPDGGYPSQLQKLDMRLLNNSECSEMIMSRVSSRINHDLLNNAYDINENKLCAMAEPNSTLCSGDSGGPLTIKSNKTGSFTQVGIVSYSLGNCIVGSAVVFTRVSELLRFIEIATATG